MEMGKRNWQQCKCCCFSSYTVRIVDENITTYRNSDDICVFTTGHAIVLPNNGWSTNIPDLLFLSSKRGSLLSIVLVLVLGIKMMHHLNENKKNNDVVITAATLATLAAIIIISVVIVSSGASTPVAATTSNTTTTTSSGLELSPQPVWEEIATNTGVTPINQTHSIATFIGNGTLTVPGTGETINMTNNGTAIISPLTESGETVSAYGKENVFSEDGHTSAIAFYEIVRYNPTTLQGKGLTMAVFDANATGSLAPFNGMMIVGTHEEDPNTRTATFTLWEWKSGIPLPISTTTTTMEEPPLMNIMTTTTTIDATAADTNTTATVE